MTGASFDKSRILPLFARVNEEGVPQVITFVDDNGDGVDISSFDFEIPVYLRPQSTTPQFTLTIGDGLTVQGGDDHQLRIDISAVRAAQRPDTYFWRLYSSSEDHTWLNGPFYFHQGEFDGVNDPDAFTISENGTEITVTIQGGSSSTFVGLSDGPGAFTGKGTNMLRVNSGETALEYRTVAQVKSDLSLNNVDNTSDANKPVSTATQTALNLKQDSLGYTAENVANKDTDGTLAANSDTKYASQKAIKTYVDSKAFTWVTLSADNINNNASANTLQDCGNLLFAGVSGGVYAFYAFGQFDSALTSNGSRWVISCNSVTSISYMTHWANAALNQARNAANAVNLPAAASAASAYTSGNFFEITAGVIEMSGNDNVRVAFASEGSGVAVTAKGGKCFLLYRRIS